MDGHPIPISRDSGRVGCREAHDDGMTSVVILVALLSFKICLCSQSPML